MLMNMLNAINNALDLGMQDDPGVVVLGEDVGKDGGVFRVTDGLLDKHPNQVFDTPLAEDGIIGMSVGMALAGMHPVPEIQFAGFMWLSFNQIVNHAARYRARTRSRFSVPMTIRTPVSGGVRALEHHSESPEAPYAHIGGLVVVEPSNPYDAKGLLIKSLHMQDPVVFLEPTLLYRLFKQEVPEDRYEVETGKASYVRKGSALTIITYGTMVHEVSAAVEKSNVDAEVIDLRTISPFDEKTILESVKKTGKAMIVHEAPTSFGVGAEISAMLAEKAIYDLSAPVIRIAAPSFPYPMPGYEKFYVPNQKRISAAIEKIVKA